MIKRNHHYVWKHYIDAWANQNGKIYCSRHNKNPFPTNPKNVMVERDFYKLHLLDKHDVEFLNAYIERTALPELKQALHGFAKLFFFIPIANAALQNDSYSSPAQKRAAKKLLIEAEENIHAKIENEAVPLLNELRNKRSEFVRSDEFAATFFLFITQQYCRTKRIRDDVKIIPLEIVPKRNFSKLANIICYINAVKIAFTLYSMNDELDIAFLENSENLGFVTGDQPVINLLANRGGGSTTGTTLYYPLSPNLSCLIGPKQHELQSKQVPDKIVEELNGFIAWNSNHFIVGDSITSIQRAIEKRPFPNQSAQAVLERIVKVT